MAWLKKLEKRMKWFFNVDGTSYSHTQPCLEEISVTRRLAGA
jgi:hypothetical protein